MKKGASITFEQKDEALGKFWIDATVTGFCRIKKHGFNIKMLIVESDETGEQYNIFESQIVKK